MHGHIFERGSSRIAREREYVRRGVVVDSTEVIITSTQPWFRVRTREKEKGGRETRKAEEGGLASESETVNVYSVRVRRISSADKTGRTSGARCEFRMDVGATRLSLCVGARYVFLRCCARTDRSILSLVSHRVASIFLQAFEMKPGQSAVFSQLERLSIE